MTGSELRSVAAVADRAQRAGGRMSDAYLQCSLIPASFLRDNCWMHDAKPIWIVRYPATQDRAEFYQAYRAIENVPVGCDPGSVNNRRIGTERGFTTFGGAVEAAEAVEA